MTSAIKKDKPQTQLRTIKVKGPGRKQTSAHTDNVQPVAAQKNNGDGGIQVEEIVNRGLDLAEVGIGLGVNIVARLGTIFKDQVFDKFSGSDILTSVMNDMPQGQQQDENAYGNNQGFEGQTQAHNNTTASSTQEEQTHYLFNRKALTPGGELALSFSINNDSLTSAKTVTITVEKFISETGQIELDASLFTVIPDKIVIAAADFEKFILKAKLPTDVTAGTYHGWIMVEEQQVYRIPVVLFVSAAQQDSPNHQSTQAKPQESFTE